MQVKGLRIHSPKLNKPIFRVSPEAFNPVDMGLVSGKFVLPVAHLQVLSITDIDQAVIPSPVVRIDDTFETDLSTNILLQRGLRAIWRDLGIDAAVPFEDTEEKSLAIGT